MRYCSASCRSAKPSNRTDLGIEASFLRLLQSGRQATCTCEQVQLHDGQDRAGIAWRERYRRAARRLANVKQLCVIEHEEKAGKWEAGDGKGSMRVEIRADRVAEAEQFLLAFDRPHQSISNMDD